MVDRTPWASSYLLHAEHLARDLAAPDRKPIHDSWFAAGTVDRWRHHRMYEGLRLLQEEAGDAAWLTVGDGRYGLDSIVMRRLGYTDVLPTDIGPALLEDALRRGLIDRFGTENAEALSFEDGRFDYTFCKETLHHCPRPYIALYEMIRVSRRGVLIVEPQDPAIDYERAHEFNARDEPVYEGSGNYLFRLSRRELEKTALGVDIPQVAFKNINDYYEQGVEFAEAAPGDPAFEKIQDTIARMDAESERGERPHSLLLAGLFHEPLGPSSRQAMEQAGWAVLDLHRNPHFG